MDDRKSRASAEIVDHLNEKQWLYKRLAALVAQFLSWRVYERYRESNLPVLHLYRHRVKDVQSLRRNLAIEGRYSSIDTSTITDLAGARLIFYFRDDLDEFCSDVHPFVDWFGQFSETTFHRVTGSKRPNGQRETPGYDSYHFVVRVTPRTVFWRSLQDTDRRNLTGLYCEVQLRTILRHAWAEAEHDLRYKIPIPLREDQNKVFTKTAMDIETADDSFVSIKRELKHFHSHLFPPGEQLTKGWEYSPTASPLSYTCDDIRYDYEVLHSFKEGGRHPDVAQLADIFDIDRVVNETVDVAHYKRTMWALLSDQEPEFLSSIQWDSLVVRACNWDHGTATITVQPAHYSDQVVTNHKRALNKIIPGTDRSVSSLGYDGAGALLPFSASPMSNTIGVACAIRVENDFWIVAHRSRAVAFDPGMWGCPASGALEWTELGHWTSRDFVGWFLGGMSRECEEEIGYKAEGEDFVYLAFAREVGRVGKPQLFFLLDLKDKLARDIISMWSTYTPPRSADPSARTEFQELKTLQTSEVRTLVGSDAANVNTLTGGSGLSEELRMSLVLALEYLALRD